MDQEDRLIGLDPLEAATLSDDDIHWQESAVTMGTFDSTNATNSDIVVIDVGSEEEPLHTTHGGGDPYSPPKSRRSSLKDFFDGAEETERKASRFDDEEKFIGIRYNNETGPLSDDELHLFRGLIHKKKGRRNSGESSAFPGHASMHSVDTETREKTVKSKLSPDTFSFLIASPVRSYPFIAGLFILGLKAAIFSLIAANLVDRQNKGNPLGVPTAVPAPVIIGQFLALFVAVATQDDIVTALNLADEGYSSTLMHQAHPAATRRKWLFGMTTLLLTGALGLAVTFMLVVTASEVVELMLNFTAIEFVSLLDNVTFILAKTGLLGLASKAKALEIEEREYRVAMTQKATRRKQSTTLVITFFLLVFGWVVIFYFQISGKYTPHAIVVQFDDEVVLELGTYSGTYILHNDPLTLGFARIRYDNVNGQGSFAYCEENKFWTFRIDPGEPCEDILVRSSQTQSFDITTTAESQWLVTSDPKLGRFFPMDIFHIALGCGLDEDCGGVGHGVCEEDRCVCNPSYFGTNCDFSDEVSCTKLELDAKSLSQQGVPRYANTYHVVSTESGEKPQVYDRYVYASDFASDQSADVIIFTGLRWVMAQLPAELNATTSNLGEVLSQDDAFLAHTILATPYYLVSEPLLVNTHANSAVPLNFQWYPVKIIGGEAQRSLPVVVDIFCATCNDDSNPCQYENTCHNGECQCTNGASGTLCQHTPTADGNCNFEFFNKAAFNYDDGDCCATTCYNTEENMCGVVEKNGVDNIFVGFPHCDDSNSNCESSEEPCFEPQIESIESLSKFNEALVTLSANGRIVAVAEPTLDSVRVFDNVDAGWMQRGPSLDGGRRTKFGKKVAMAKSPGEVVGRINYELPLVMAIGYGIDGHASVRVVQWMKSASSWSVIASDIHLCQGAGCDIASLDVATDGDRIVVAASSNIDFGTTFVYSTISNETFTGMWESVLTLDGTYASLSERGHVVAVARTDEPTVTRMKVVSNTDEALVSQGDLVLSVHNLSAFGPDSVIGGIKMNLAGDHITSFIEGSSQKFSLTRFPMSALLPRPHPGTNLGYATPPFVDFSEDGTIVILTGKVSSQHRFKVLQTYSFSEQKQQWRKLGNYVPVNAQARQFATSFDGGTFVVGGNSPSEVYRLKNQCNGTEVQLALSMDSAPTNVSWNMRSFRYLGDIMLPTETTMKICDHCYEDSLFRALVSYTDCVPANECLQFSFQANGGFQEGSGLVLFVDGQEKVVLNSTHSDFNSLQVHANESCQLDSISCDTAQSLLTVIVQLDGNADETSWYLRDSMNNTLDEASYSITQRDVHQVCVPTQECLALTFEDTLGDGFCCNSGNGGYSLFLDGSLVTERSGAIGFGERVFFGDCETKLVHPVEAELVIEFDRKPSETSWLIRDIGGREVASGGPYVEFQELVADPIILPVDSNVIETFTLNWNLSHNQSLGEKRIFSRRNETALVDMFFSGIFGGLIEAYYEALNITNISDLFICDPWIYDTNSLNSANDTNTPLEATFNETICNANEDSMFVLSGIELSLSRLFSHFNETLNVTDLFEYKYVNLHETNPTDFDFGSQLQTTESLHLFTDETHELVIEDAVGGGVLGGNYELIYSGEPIVNVSNSPMLTFEISPSSLVADMP